MTEPTKATIKALAEYGYVRYFDVFKNETKGKCWTWIEEGHFLLLVRVAGDWFPVANHYNSAYAASERAKDHSWYEFPERWVWEFTEEEVRKSYQDGMKARKAHVAAIARGEDFAGLVPG